VNYAKKDKNLVISKWMIVSTLDKQLKGQLHLMVPHGQITYTKHIIEANSIDAHVLSLKRI
jgi:hypothetical protein